MNINNKNSTGCNYDIYNEIVSSESMLNIDSHSTNNMAQNPTKYNVEK